VRSCRGGQVRMRAGLPQCSVWRGCRCRAIAPPIDTASLASSPVGTSCRKRVGTQSSAPAGDPPPRAFRQRQERIARPVAVSEIQQEGAKAGRSNSFVCLGFSPSRLPVNLVRFSYNGRARTCVSAPACLDRRPRRTRPARTCRRPESGASPACRLWPAQRAARRRSCACCAP
jgi:hypothetical protein